MPVLGRLCQHLENNCIAQFASCLGLDEKKYQDTPDDLGIEE